MGLGRCPVHPMGLKGSALALATERESPNTTLVTPLQETEEARRVDAQRFTSPAEMRVGSPSTSWSMGEIDGRGNIERR